MTRSRLPTFALLLCLLAAGCRDARRDVAREYLQSHAPAGFAVVNVPENLPIRDVSAAEGGLVVSVRYRTVAPTIEARDGFDLPAARAVDKRFAELRGWALSSLPADSPLRARFLATIADAHGAFPVKRIVTTPGTKVDAITTLTLRKSGKDWQVIEMKSDAAVPGAPDADPRIPLEDAPEVATRVAGLASVADQLDAARRDHLAARKRAADRSLAQLRAIARTGETFAASLPDGSPLRLVITRGLESAEPPIAILTVQGAEQSTARFSGALEQTASGETVWRAAQAITLASPSLGEIPAVTNAARHPVLTFSAAGNQLVGEFVTDGKSPVRVRFRPTGFVELIPESAPQPTDNQ